MASSLGQFATFDKNKMREIARKGAAASAETKTQKRQIRTMLQAILDGKYSVLDADGAELNLTGYQVMALRAFENAITPGPNQTRWWEFVRDTVGEKPKDEVELIDTRVVVDIEDDSGTDKEEDI